VTASLSSRYRLDDLRRLATGLTSSLGVTPPRASALATHLLWFDAAGASSYGIATLPSWLDRLESKQIDPTAQGKVVLEHSGTAVFDAQQGLPQLALEAAAGIASEKARDVGIGIVRVRNIGPTGPSAPIAAGLAIGPFVAMIAGPSPSLAMALPTPEGLPAVFDSDLEREGGASPAPPEEWLSTFGPWISTVAGEEGWLILAFSVPAMESLSAFHERASRATCASADGRGPLAPETLASRRREAREHGVQVAPASMARLKEWAGRANVAWPAGSGG
jgi:LDH2 family malate/lactate/ureidoglycolate dehydrogenase